jgi:hypothetical protein
VHCVKGVMRLNVAMVELHAAEVGVVDGQLGTLWQLDSELDDEL